MKAVAKQYGIRCESLYDDCNINPHISAQETYYMGDGVHYLEETAHALQGRLIAGWIAEMF
jgi:hypothetical protein